MANWPSDTPNDLGSLFGRHVLKPDGRPTAAWDRDHLVTIALPYPMQSLPLGRKIASMVGRVDYVRVVIRDGKVEPLAVSGASVLSSTTRADGFVLVPGDLEGYAEGAEVRVYLYDRVNTLPVYV